MKDNAQANEGREYNKAALCPVKECTLSVDVVIKSSDGKIFGAHSKNLDAFSDAFAPASTASAETTREPVTLTETADVVRLLLRFMHNHRLPQLEHLALKFVLKLGDAAEKYFVYSLMELVKLHLKYRFLEHNATTVIVYAAKHEYDDLFDDAAPRTIGWHVDDAYEALGVTRYFTAWVRYRDKFEYYCLHLRDLFEYEPRGQQHKGGYFDCPKWDEFMYRLLSLSDFELRNWEMQMLLLIREVLCDCEWCFRRGMQWRKSIKAELGDPLPKASSLLRST